MGCSDLYDSSPELVFLSKIFIFQVLNLLSCVYVFSSLSYSWSCTRVAELIRLIWSSNPARSSVPLFGEGSFSLLVYREREMIVAGCEPKLGKDRAWGVGKKKQVHGEKAGLLDLLSGSCKYLGKRDSECISYSYPDTCLFLLKRPGSQETWERHAGGWRMAKNEAGRQRTGTHFVSDT